MDIRAVCAGEEEGKGGGRISLQPGAAEEAMLEARAGSVPPAGAGRWSLMHINSRVYLRFLMTSSLPWSPAVQDL